MFIKSRHIKKSIGILCVLAILMSTLVGCKNSNGTKTTSDTGATIDSNTEHINISIMTNNFYDDTGIAAGQVFAQIQAMTNATISMTWVPGTSYTSKFNVMMASGSLPDVVLVADLKSSVFMDAVQGNQFWNLDPYLKSMTNYATIPAIGLTNSAVLGKHYILPRYRDVKRIKCVYRADWLKAAGLPIPDTMDKIYTTAKAFAAGDYDGNGKKDTIGFVLGTANDGGGYFINSLWAQVVALDGINQWGLDSTGKKIINMMDTPQYMTVLQNLNKWYSEGLISPDFALQPTNGVNTDLFDKEKEGLTIGYDLPSAADPLVKSKIAANPSLKRSDIVDEVFLKDAAGNTKVPQEAGFATGYAFPKSTVKDAARLKQLLAFFNTLLTKEGQNLLENGIEGRQYKVNADGTSCTQIDPALYMKEGSDLPQLRINNNLAYQKFADELDRKHYKDITTYKPTGELIPNFIIPLYSPTWTLQANNLNKIIDTAQIKYIMGQETLDQFKADIKLWHTSGGDKVYTEYTSSYNGKTITSLGSSTSSVLSSSK